MATHWWFGHRRTGRGGIRSGTRTLVLGAAAAAMVAGTVACSPSGSGTSDGASSAPLTTLVVARTGDIDKLDPQLATAFQTVQTLNLVYSTLVKTDVNGQIQPDLATKWDYSADGKTLTFTLRSGVTWHDGSPFTSADVKASIERILNQSTGAVGRSNLLAISTVDAPDDTTVVLHLSAPSAALLYSLAAVNASVESAKNIAAGTVGKTPDGTGPYQWKQWDQGQQVVLTANARYYGGAPKVSTLELRVIPNESSILSGMKAGAFQLGIISDPGVAQQAGTARR
jgi:peptide/nickel transport system substrate-binding protein